MSMSMSMSRGGFGGGGVWYGRSGLIWCDKVGFSGRWIGRVGRDGLSGRHGRHGRHELGRRLVVGVGVAGDAVGEAAEAFQEAALAGGFGVVLGDVGAVVDGLLDFETGGGVVAAAEGGDGAQEAGEVFEVGEGRIVKVAVPFADGVEDAGGEQAGGMVGHEWGDFFQLCCVVQGFAGISEEVAADLPFEVAAVAPFGQVLLGDGFVMEEFAEDFFDGGEGVEPGDDPAAGIVAVEAVVDGGAEGKGKAGDFAGAVHNGGF
jgi:hypothetical protein